GAAQPVRFEIAAPGVDVLARHPAELLERVAKELVLRIDDRIRSVGADHPSRPAALANGRWGGRRFGGPSGGPKPSVVNFSKSARGRKGGLASAAPMVSK